MIRKEEFAISLIIPAYNEEVCLAATVEDLIEELNKNNIPYEIFIINDSSSDNTSIVADALTRRDPKIKLINNEKNMGIGYNFKRGVELANYPYVVLIPADNAYYPEEIVKCIELTRYADIIIFLTLNMHIRPLHRQVLNYIFVKLNQIIFNVDLKIINCPVIFKKEILEQFEIRSSGFGYQCESLIKTVRLGYPYLEYGVHIRKRQGGESKSLSCKSFKDVFLTLSSLIREIYILQYNRYSAEPRRVRIFEENIP